ncbi:TPA: hypothetical protein ACIPUI_000221 [Citrobacter freundii]
MAAIANPDFDNSRYRFCWSNFYFDPDYIDIDCRLRFSYQSPGSTEAKCWQVHIQAYDSKSLTFSAVEAVGGKVIYFNIRRIVAGSVVDPHTNHPIVAFSGQYLKDRARSHAYQSPLCKPAASAPPPKAFVSPPAKPIAAPGAERTVVPPANSVRSQPTSVVVKRDLDIRIVFFSGVYNKISVAMRVESLCKDPHSGAFFLRGINESSARQITLKNTMVSDGIYYHKQRYDWSAFIYQLSSGQLPSDEPTETDSAQLPSDEPTKTITEQPVPDRAPVAWVAYMNARAEQGAQRSPAYVAPLRPGSTPLPPVEKLSLGRRLVQWFRQCWRA